MEFAPFSVLQDVLYWWHAQENAPKAMKLAAKTYFTGAKRKLDEFDPFFEEPDLAAFAEWYLLEFPLPRLNYGLDGVDIAGKTVAELYVELLGDEEVQAARASRYGVWQVASATESRLTLQPYTGGEALEIHRSDAPEGWQADAIVVGRLYALADRWLPSPTMAVVTASEAERLASLEPEALAQQLAPR